MKKLKVILSILSLALVLAVAAGLAGCPFGIGGDTSGGDKSNGMPTGTYEIMNKGTVCDYEYLGGYDTPITAQISASSEGKIVIGADKAVTLTDVGTHNNGRGLNLTGSKDFPTRYVENNGVYSIERKLSGSNDFQPFVYEWTTNTIKYKLYLSFTYGDNVITLKITYKLESDETKGMTITSFYKNNAA